MMEDVEMNELLWCWVILLKCWDILWGIEEEE